MINARLFLSGALFLCIFNYFNLLFAMEHNTNKDDTIIEMALITDMQGYGSLESTPRKKLKCTYLMLLKYLPIDLITEKIIPYMINTEKFLLATNPEKYRDVFLVEKYVRALFYRAAQAAQYDVSEEIDDLSNQPLHDKGCIIYTNREQLNKLSYHEKQEIMNTVLKFIESDNPEELVIFDEASSRTILISLLDRCSNDFSAISPQDRERLTLENLIEIFKNTFGHKTITEKIKTVVSEGNLCRLLVSVPIGLLIITFGIALCALKGPLIIGGFLVIIIGFGVAIYPLDVNQQCRKTCHEYF